MLSKKTFAQNSRKTVKNRYSSIKNLLTLQLISTNTPYTFYVSLAKTFALIDRFIVALLKCMRNHFFIFFGDSPPPL
ncbi:hypothetical protein QFZ87_004668 [Bacillus sp. SLBN-46]|nr:hypothetical protein [Bacillus sp. SLBN-46]